MRRVLVLGAAMGLIFGLVACGSSNDNGGGSNKDVINGQDNGGKLDVGPGQDDGGKIDPGPEADVQPNNDIPQNDIPQDEGTTTTDIPSTENPGNDNGGTEDGAAGCLNCAGYADCVNQCPQGATGCLQACANQACEGAAAAFQGFVQCFQQHCMDAYNHKNNVEVLVCIVDNCLDQYVGCYHGDTYKTCVDVTACMNDCPNDNPQTQDVDEQYQCIDGCRSNATEEAAKDYWNLIGCGGRPCVDKCNCAQACQNQNSQECKTCQDNCDKCFSGALQSDECKPYVEKCTPHGDQTCGQIVRCMNACPQSPEDQARQCIRDCQGKGTLDAQDQYYAWVKCGLDACPTECQDTTSQACNDCWVKAVSKGGQCYDQRMACYKDIPSDGVHCKETLDCESKATTYDQLYDCEYKATKEAQEMLYEIQDCVAAACENDCKDIQSQEGQQKCNDCIKKAQSTENDSPCKDKVQACLNDSGAQGGGQ